MKRSSWTPTRPLVALVVLGLLSLIALPGLGRYSPPEGALLGSVRGPDGRPVRECLVALFDGDALQLLEVVHTDKSGRFAFQKAPPTFHALAHPEPSTGLVAAWLMDRDSSSGDALELDLERGRMAHIEVRDEAGEPLPGVEVRVYAVEPEPRLVARANVDDDGSLRLVVPARVHLGAVPLGDELLQAWRFNENVPDSGGFFPLVVRPGKRLQGRVVLDDGRAADEAIVSSWDHEDGRWSWNGYTLTDEEGNFATSGRGEGTELLALAPGRVVLPARRVVRSDAESQNLVLAHGLPLELFVADVAQHGRTARVWFWSEDANAWSFGMQTDDEGRVLTTVSELFSVVAQPFAGAGLPSEAWDRVYDSPRLRLAPGSTGR